jgi:hypothetical protein
MLPAVMNTASTVAVRREMRGDEVPISMYSMVVPSRDGVNDKARPPQSGVGGWLLLLCLLLLVGQPVLLAIGAARALGALPMRGLPLALVLVGELMVAGLGVGAGMALLGGRRGAATFATWSLVLSAAADLFAYSTPFLPNNRPPGTTPIYMAASMMYYAIWIAYLSRSRRVRNTFTA